MLLWSTQLWYVQSQTWTYVAAVLCTNSCKKVAQLLTYVAAALCTDPSHCFQWPEKTWQNAHLCYKWGMFHFWRPMKQMFALTTLSRTNTPLYMWQLQTTHVNQATLWPMWQLCSCTNSRHSKNWALIAKHSHSWCVQTQSLTYVAAVLCTNSCKKLAHCWLMWQLRYVQTLAIVFSGQRRPDRKHTCVASEFCSISEEFHV